MYVKVTHFVFCCFLHAFDNSGCACGLYWLVGVSWSIIVWLYLLLCRIFYCRIFCVFMCVTERVVHELID